MAISEGHFLFCVDCRALQGHFLKGRLTGEGPKKILAFRRSFFGPSLNLYFEINFSGFKLSIFYLMVYQSILWYFFAPMVSQFLRILLPKVYNWLPKNTKNQSKQRNTKGFKEYQRTKGPKNTIAEKEKRKEKRKAKIQGKKRLRPKKKNKVVRLKNESGFSFCGLTSKKPDWKKGRIAFLWPLDYQKTWSQNGPFAKKGRVWNHLGQLPRILVRVPHAPNSVLWWGPPPPTFYQMKNRSFVKPTLWTM